MPEDRQGRRVHFTADVWSGKDLSHSFLKGWPLIQPTNRLAHTQLSADNHLSNLRAHPPPTPTHCDPVHFIRQPRDFGGMAAALRQQCFFPPPPPFCCFCRYFSHLTSGGGIQAEEGLALRVTPFPLQSPTIIDDTRWTRAAAGGESSSAMHQRLSPALY